MVTIQAMRSVGPIVAALLLGVFCRGAEFVQFTNRTASAISGDGTTVVGATDIYGFWWKNGQNVDLLGNPGNPYQDQRYVQPTAVSMTGQVAVGDVWNTFYSPPYSIYGSAIWCAIPSSWGGQGPFVYGPGTSLSGSSVCGVSANGNIAVGVEAGVAKRWTYVVPSGPLNLTSTDVIGSWAPAAISADGNTIAGTSSGQACYWTTNGEVSVLGFLDGATDSTANAISGDGKSIVGVSGGQAFLWTQGSGMIGLGDLPGGSFSSTALGVSYDGSVVVGWGTTTNGQEAFIWDSTNGMRNLGAVLQTYGVNLDSITLSSAVGVSWSGNEFCGNGTGGAWYASIARKLECSANGSNLVFTWSTNEVGLGVEWTSDLSSGAWSWVTNSVILTNHLNTLSVPTVNAPQGFFRLRKQ